jgi:predicted acetyltransferase
VRPARRGQGHATRALALALDRAAELGIDRALVTCDFDNEPSRRTIERNGGVYEDRRADKLRYWIDTAARGHSGR